MNKESLRMVLAKSDGTTLVQHTHDVISVGKEILNSLPLCTIEKNILTDKFILAAILHDLGKIHPLFREVLTGKQVSIRHELVSLWFGSTFLNLENDILFAVATHHKNIVRDNSYKALSIYDLTCFSDLYEQFSDEMTLETIQNWLAIFDLNVEIKQNIEVKSSLDKYFMDVLREKQLSITTVEEKYSFSLLRGLLQAADHIASAGIKEIPKYRSIKLSDFQPKEGEIIYPFRHFQETLQTWTGDVILHAPTGSGKTEAAFSWIYSNQSEHIRIIYLLPYTASINAMSKRFKSVFSKEIVTIQHSKSLNYIYDELLSQTDNYNSNYKELQLKARNINSLIKEIYFPIKVATLHQILRTPLRGKGWELSLLDYKNALFIIDEFHAYNALLTGMMLETIKLFKCLLNAKFMFMSATIPDFLLNKIINEVYDGDKSKLLRPDASHPSDAAILSRKRHRLRCQKGEGIYSAIPLIEKELAEGNSVIVIVNNVKTCQEVFARIHMAKEEKMMLHSGFNLISRKEIESKITNENKTLRPKLLVATQAVEVSLDIDYNVAFIENAPIDALIQRFGRVNRAGKLCNKDGNHTLATLYLFEKIEGKTPFYDEQLLIDTWNNLQAFNNKELSEDDLIQVCNAVYKEGYTHNQDADFNQGKKIIEFLDKQWLAGDYHDWIDNILEKNNQKIDVLCYNLEDKYRKFIEQKRYIEANQLLVPVYPYIKHKLLTVKNDKVFLAEELEYNSEIGYIQVKREAYEII